MRTQLTRSDGAGSGGAPSGRARIGRGAATAVAVLGMLAASLATATAAAAEPSNGLVINEVYGGGGNSGAAYTNDFIEVANCGISAVDLTGWSVQYHSKAATGTWQTTPLSGSIAPGARYVVAEAKGNGGTSPLPQADASGTIAMSATDGTVALVSNSAALTCADAASCETRGVAAIRPSGDTPR